MYRARASRPLFRVWAGGETGAVTGPGQETAQCSQASEQRHWCCPVPQDEHQRGPQGPHPRGGRGALKLRMDLT